jgi:hypothetical protein
MVISTKGEPPPTRRDCRSCGRKGVIMTTATPKEIAAQFGTSAKTLRKFLRQEAKDAGVETPGKGGRWAIERKTLRSLRKRFDAWQIAQAEAKAARLAEAAESDNADNEDEVLEDAGSEG